MPTSGSEGCDRRDCHDCSFESLSILRIKSLKAPSLVSPPTVEVRILDKRVHEWGLPQYHSEMAAAVDLYACIDDPLLLAPQEPAVLVPSGIAIHIRDSGIAGLIVPRSGLGHGKGLVMGNLIGLIDPDYIGPLMVSVWNRSQSGGEPIRIEPGDRIAQLTFVPILRPRFQTVFGFAMESARGTGGFGSTGDEQRQLGRASGPSVPP